MRLDPDLFRAILLKVEDAPPNQRPDNLMIEGWTPDEVLEHIELLEEAGLIEARILRSGSGGGRLMAAYVERLTYAGHDFLAKARDESRWKQAKSIAVEKTGSTALDVLKTVLGQLAIHALKLQG